MSSSKGRRSLRTRVQRTATYRSLAYRRQASWARSARQTLGLSSRRPGQRPIRLWWWRGSTPNLGDELTWLLVERITGRRTVRRPLSECDLVGVGSHLEKVYAGVGSNRPLVLGSGFLDAGGPVGDLSLPVLALRGRHTRERVSDVSDDVLLADPGLLAPELLVGGVPARRRDSVVVVPHGMHVDTPFVEAARRVAGVDVVDVRNNPLDTIATIAGSQFVYSSSLHGLVIADSFGVPNAWIKPGIDLYGGDWKFADYYSSFGLERSAVGLGQIGDDLAAFAKTGIDNPDFAVPGELVQQKQQRLTELLRDCASI